MRPIERQPLLGLLRDVRHREQHAGSGSIGGDHTRRGEAAAQPRAVGTQVALLQVDVVAEPGHEPGDRRCRPCAVVGLGDAREALVVGEVVRQPEQVPEAAVHRDRVAVHVEHRQRDRDDVEQVEGVQRAQRSTRVERVHRVRRGRHGHPVAAWDTAALSGAGRSFIR